MVPFVLAACRAELTDSPAPIVADREALSSDPADGVAPYGIGAIWSAGGEVRVSPPAAEPEVIEAGSGWPRIRAAALLPEPGAGVDAEALLVLGGDGALLAWDGVGLGPSLLDQAVDGPVDGIAGDDGAVWIRTPSGLSRWRDGSIAPYLLDGAPILGPIAPGCRVDGLPAVWVADDGGTWAIDPETGAVIDGNGWIADALGCDATGALYAGVRGALHRVSRGVDLEIPLAGSVAAVWADPQGQGAWIAVDDGPVHGLVHAVGDLASPVDADAPGSATVDPLGRLLIADDAGITRLSVGHPVAVVGLPASVDAPTPFTVVPTASDMVPVLSASVVPCAPTGDCSDAAVAETDAAPILLDGAVGVIDPLRFPVGPSRLDAVASYPDGTVARRSVAFRIAPGDDAITWTTAVEPLYDARCAICHAGGTETRLDSKDAWIASIDDVVREVESGAMPLGGPPLTPTELALVTTWRDTGFP